MFGLLVSDFRCMGEVSDISLTKKWCSFASLPFTNCACYSDNLEGGEISAESKGAITEGEKQHAFDSQTKGVEFPTVNTSCDGIFFIFLNWRMQAPALLSKPISWSL